MLRSEGEKQSDMIKKNYQETMRNFKNKRENFLNKRELFNYSKTELQNLNESTMYISVFISLSTTLPEVNQRGKEITASNYP